MVSVGYDRLPKLRVTLDKEHQSSDWGGEMSPGMVECAARDAEVLLPMADSLTAKVVDAALEKVSEIERRALPAMVWMQNAGLPLNARGWTEYLGQVEQEIDFLKKRLREIAPVRPGGKEWNWNSSPQTKKVFALEGIELPNVTSETLSRHDHPLIGPLLRYRKASKLVSHFGPSLLKFVREDGRVYADWR